MDIASTDTVKDYAIRVQLFPVIAVLRVDVMDEAVCGVV